MNGPSLAKLAGAVFCQTPGPHARNRHAGVLADVGHDLDLIPDLLVPPWDMDPPRSWKPDYDCLVRVAAYQFQTDVICACEDAVERSMAVPLQSIVDK